MRIVDGGPAFNKARPRRVVDLAGDKNGLERHHAASTADALVHQHVPGIQDLPHAAVLQGIGHHPGCADNLLPLRPLNHSQRFLHLFKIHVH